jgi:uncharacterized protein YjaG (DUF416 family)
MVPGYVRFAEAELWGDPEGLRRVLERIWQYLEGLEAIGDDLTELEGACERATPDSEAHTSRLTSAALDAAIALTETLKLISDGDWEHAAEVSTLASDSIDMWIQLTDAVEPSGPAMEQHISQHPLMRREMTRQVEDLTELLATQGVSSETVRRFRCRSSYDLLSL